MQAERCRHHDADVGGSRVKSDSLSEVGQIREKANYSVQARAESFKLLFSFSAFRSSFWLTELGFWVDCWNGCGAEKLGCKKKRAGCPPGQ